MLPTIFRATLIGLTALCGCGPVNVPSTTRDNAPTGFGGVDGTAVSADSCSIPRGETKPFVVEWNAARRNEVKQLANDGVLLVVNSGCSLQILDGCIMQNGYVDVHSGGAREMDSFKIKDERELLARLPLGYAALEGKLQADDYWTLEYVFGDSKKAQTSHIIRSELPPACAAATHFVSRIMLGAYRLRSSKTVQGNAGVGREQIGLSGKTGRESEIIREGADFEKCADPSVPSVDQSCQAIVQLYLKEIVDGENTVTATDETAVETAVDTDTETQNAVDSDSSSTEKAAATALPDEIQQPDSNVFWLRCAAGQTRIESSCSGEITLMKWADASLACPEGYRLPTREEFAALLGRCDNQIPNGRHGRCSACSDSTICNAMFPSDNAYYWTSSASERSPSKSWYVDFEYGALNLYAHDGRYAVRCVRSTAK